MSGHTPGPWALQMAEDCRGRQLDEMVKWVVTANSHDLWVSTGPTWDAEHDAEALANARLIAAAPELLEALRGLLNRANDELADPEDVVEISAARAAIARATGAQP